MADDNFCGHSLTGLEYVTSEFSLFCYYFELIRKTNAKLDTYLKYVVAAGYGMFDTMFLILEFLVDAIFF